MLLKGVIVITESYQRILVFSRKPLGLFFLMRLLVFNLLSFLLEAYYSPRQQTNNFMGVLPIYKEVSHSSLQNPVLNECRSLAASNSTRIRQEQAGAVIVFSIIGKTPSDSSCLFQRSLAQVTYD